MIVLVRCCDDTYSLALKSRLDHLVKDGLITAFLRDGEWILIGHPRERGDRTQQRIPKRRLAALVSSF